MLDYQREWWFMTQCQRYFFYDKAKFGTSLALNKAYRESSAKHNNTHSE